MFKKRKMSKNMRKFVTMLDNYNSEKNDTLPSVDSQLVIDCICDLFLGEDYYIVEPLPNCQANVVILDEILFKYCKEYRDLKKTKKP